MSERLLNLGVTPEYFAHAKHFEGVFRNLGWSQTQIDAALKWGAEFKGAPTDIYPQFTHLAEQHGIERVEVDLAELWLGQVNDRGIENMPQVAEPVSSSEADGLRLREIETEMRKPKADSEYWKNPNLRDEYRELLERLDGKEYGPAPTGEDAGRKAEIENTMKTDRALYHRSGMDAEYLQILQRESGEVPEAAAGESIEPAQPAGDTNAEFKPVTETERARSYVPFFQDAESWLIRIERQCGSDPILSTSVTALSLRAVLALIDEMRPRIVELLKLQTEPAERDNGEENVKA